MMKDFWEVIDLSADFCAPLRHGISGLKYVFLPNDKDVVSKIRDNIIPYRNLILVRQGAYVDLLNLSSMFFDFLTMSLTQKDVIKSLI